MNEPLHKSGSVRPRTLLVLGSKPDPVLPPADSFDAVACANASGFSAKRHGLADPVYTVMTGVLTSGKASDEHSLRAVRGLRTGTLYHLPRPKTERLHGMRAAVQTFKQWRMQPWNMRRRLRALDFRYDQFVARRASDYHAMIVGLCGSERSVAKLLEQKQASTGVVTLAIGIAESGFERFVVSGFDFTLTHAYGQNPLIEQRRDAASKHADTDVTIMRKLHEYMPSLFTTEPTVHAKTGVPYLPEIVTEPLG
jgi:hypothetical protein